MEDVLYTVPQVAELIHTNQNYVGALINSGILPYLKMGHRKIRKSALEEFLEKWEGWDLTDPYNPVEIKKAPEAATSMGN
ncbi:helix-turn-helix domain-containing protein [Anaerostipes hominis (ex Lee et al. 2021)]|uniref:helix-turn-helix domain-containing protein n=1 Tax=Anaerostipes hominis (ex Lee et al. 2021) TaxID=2025494 RepID=UPI0022DEAA5B|nr:helix-turn-helix domain-containing protein [Anaerostipes hominis (ex Lee et al. 2021)]